MPEQHVLLHRKQAEGVRVNPFHPDYYGRAAAILEKVNS